MKKLLLIGLWACLSYGVSAQSILTLDSCRALALQGNKQLAAARMSGDVASNVQKAARTQYLPKVDAIGGYSYMNKEVSILNDEQKAAFSNVGTNLGASLNASGMATQLAQALAQMGINPQILSTLPATLNGVGQGVVDAFRTDTRSMWAGSVMVRQPLYMGGALRAANRMADIGRSMADSQIEQQLQSTLYDVDKVYWLVVSLRQKQRLAHSFLELVQHLDDDVHKMIDEGVATRADGLKVDVKVNEADMQVTEVEDGLALARMLLCQLCGLPLDSDFLLADEAEGAIEQTPMAVSETAIVRPELQVLENMVELSHQNERLVRSAYLPHVGAVGGYSFSNPNVFNGFEKKVAGFWNVGVLVHVPVWNWMEGRYKVRAAKAATSIARMTLDDAREKIDLQVAQSRFKVSEAEKKLVRARKNIASAEENLRCANAGFREGVMDATTVMEAQTAWQAAQTQKIDAEIDVKLSQTALQKALGQLKIEN